MQLATLQAESEQKIAQVKEELEDTQNAYEALKQEVERRDSVLATKQQTEDSLESARADCQAAKLANDEYRRVLRTKNSELSQFKRDSESLTKIQQLKIKELELAANQDQKRLEQLQSENETLLK